MMLQVQRGVHSTTKEVQIYGRKRGSFPQTNNYLDDVFKLKDLLGLEKNIAKTVIENLIVIDLFQVPNLKWKRQLAMIEIPTISFMLFRFFLPNYWIFEGIAIEMQLHFSFVLSLSSHPVLSILRFG